MPYEIDQETVLVHADEIRVGRNIKNIRTVFDDERIRELAQSIYEDGLLQPIIITETDDPDSGTEITELVAGARRLRAIKFILQNMDEDWTCSDKDEPGMIRCSQFAGDLEDADLLNAAENIEREDVDNVDIAAWLHRMTDSRGWTQADLGKRLHRSPQWVSARITLHEKGSDSLKEVIRTGELPFTTGYELAKRLNHEEQDKAVAKHRKGIEKLTVEDAQNVNNAKKSTRPAKKAIGDMLARAQAKAQSPDKHPNAYGIYAALRFVLGTITDEELTEVMEFDSVMAYKAQD